MSRIEDPSRTLWSPSGPPGRRQVEQSRTVGVVDQQHLPAPVRDDRRVRLWRRRMKTIARRTGAISGLQLGLARAWREPPRPAGIARCVTALRACRQSRPFATRLCLAGSHAVQVPRRNVGFEGEVEPAESVRRAPSAQRCAGACQDRHEAHETAAYGYSMTSEVIAGMSWSMVSLPPSRHGARAEKT